MAQNWHNHDLLSDRLLDLADTARLLSDSIGYEKADPDSPELALMRTAEGEAEGLERTLTKAAEAAQEGETL